MFGKQKPKSKPSSSESNRRKRDTTKSSGDSTRKKSVLVPSEKAATKASGDNRKSNDSAVKLHNKKTMAPTQVVPMPEHFFEVGNGGAARVSPWHHLGGPPPDIYSVDAAPQESADEENMQSDRIKSNRSKQLGSTRTLIKLDYYAMVEQLRGLNHWISHDEVIHRVRREKGRPEWSEPAEKQEIPGLEEIQPSGGSGCTNQFLMVDCYIYDVIPGWMYYVVRDGEEKVLNMIEVDDRADKAKVLRVVQWILDKRESAGYEGDKPSADAHHPRGKKGEVDEREERERHKEWLELLNW